MATNNSSNQEFTNNADGFALGGGTTKRTLTATGANITLTGAGANTYTFPGASDTLIGLATLDTYAEGKNITFGTTTGTRIGTSTLGKIGFFGVAPITQPVNTTELFTGLFNLGLRQSGTAVPITSSGTMTFSGQMILTGPFRASVGVQSATTVALSATTSSEYQLINATAGAVALSLPGTTAAGQRWTIKKTDATANAVTITAGTSIDGAATYVLSTQYKYVTVISTVTSGVYYIVGNN